jgi:hypothetical protein
VQRTWWVLPFTGGAPPLGPSRARRCHRRCSRRPGAHSLLDPAGHNGKPDVPLTRYRVGPHFASPAATGQITSWQSLGHAPWDQDTLYVGKGPRVVVAGPASETALVRQGFVVSVSGNAAVRNPWLTPVKQPPGWPPRFLGARVFQLPGPGTTQVDAASAGSIADGSTGGCQRGRSGLREIPGACTIVPRIVPIAPKSPLNPHRRDRRGGRCC